MIKDGVNLTTIELDEGEKIPNDLKKFDARFCMEAQWIHGWRRRSMVS